MIIKGNLELQQSTIESLGSVVKVKGWCKLNSNFNLKSLGKLKRVEGALWLLFCEDLKSLNNLEYALYIYLHGSGITSEYIVRNKPELYDRCDWKRDFW